MGGYKIIASSESLEGLRELASQFWLGSNITFDNGSVSNANGLIEGARVVQKGWRYRLEILQRF